MEEFNTARMSQSHSSPDLPCDRRRNRKDRLREVRLKEDRIKEERYKEEPHRDDRHSEDRHREERHREDRHRSVELQSIKRRLSSSETHPTNKFDIEMDRVSEGEPLNKIARKRKRARTVEPADERREPPNPVESFDELGLCAELLKGLESAKICRPNALQAAILPELIKKPASDGRRNADVFVKSAPQSGKKTALLIGALARIDQTRPVTQVLVLSPTSELALYTAALARDLAKHSAITVGCATRDDEPDRHLNQHLVISNCGTAICFMRMKFLDLSQIQCVILDEFDLLTSNSPNCGRLFDLLNYVGHYFQVQIYSTSVGRTALEFTQQHFSENLVCFDLMNEDSCMDNLLQFYVQCSSGLTRKYQTLRELLKNILMNKILIFITFKHDALFVYENLKKDGYKVILLSSKSSSNSRLDAIRSFNASENEQIIFIMNYPVGQGIGLENLHMIINWELPIKPSELHFDYFHKVCKCDRSRPSFVVNFVEPNEYEIVHTLEMYFRIRFIKLKMADDG